MSKRTRQAPEPAYLPLPETRFAQTALVGLRKAKPQVVPPIVFLHGPPGVGKSTLLRWFKNDTLAKKNSTRFHHVSAATFVEMTLEAIERNLIDELQDDFRRNDYFLCEDLAAIRKHKHIQRVLATVIDELIAAEGRIVLTASTTPGDIDGLTPRLLNRCRAAALAGITFPGLKSREKLLAHFAAQRQLAITDDAIKALAAATTASPRELAAMIVRLEFLNAGEKSNVVRVPLVERFLSGEVAAPKVSLTAIARAVAKHYGMSVAGLREPTRRRTHVAARQCAMYLARRLSGKTFIDIAVYFGRKNHSTVVHACRRFETALAAEIRLNDDLQHICGLLGIPHHSVVDNLLMD